MIGLGILTLFVENQPVASDDAISEPAPTPRAALRMVRAPGFTPLLVVGTVLSLTTMSDSFLYLTLQRRLDLDIGFFPLLYVATALVYMVLAVPIGQLADRVGRVRVFIGGYLLLLLVYASLLLPTTGIGQVVVALLLFGAYYAATEGVLMALASTVLPGALRSSGLAVLTTATSLARLVASILFGLVWTWQGVTVAVWVFVAGLIIAILLTAFWFASAKTWRSDGQATAT